MARRAGIRTRRRSAALRFKGHGRRTRFQLPFVCFRHEGFVSSTEFFSHKVIIRRNDCQKDCGKPQFSHARNGQQNNKFYNPKFRNGDRENDRGFRQQRCHEGDETGDQRSQQRQFRLHGKRIAPGQKQRHGNFVKKHIGRNFQTGDERAQLFIRKFNRFSFKKFEQLQPAVFEPQQLILKQLPQFFFKQFAQLKFLQRFVEPQQFKLLIQQKFLKLFVQEQRLVIPQQRKPLLGSEQERLRRWFEEKIAQNTRTPSKGNRPEYGDNT